MNETSEVLSRVHLSGEQIEQGELVAQSRSSHSKNPRAVRFGTSNQSANRIGAFGELIAAIYYCVYDDWVENLIEGEGDHGYDLVIPGLKGDRSYTLQVKSTTSERNSPNLIYDPELDKRVGGKSVDGYLLVTVSPTFRYGDLVGWASPRDIASLGEDRTLHDHQVRLVRARDLRPIR